MRFARRAVLPHEARAQVSEHAHLRGMPVRLLALTDASEKIGQGVDLGLTAVRLGQPILAEFRRLEQISDVFAHRTSKPFRYRLLSTLRCCTAVRHKVGVRFLQCRQNCVVIPVELPTCLHLFRLDTVALCQRPLDEFSRVPLRLESNQLLILSRAQHLLRRLILDLGFAKHICQISTCEVLSSLATVPRILILKAHIFELR